MSVKRVEEQHEEKVRSERRRFRYCLYVQEYVPGLTKKSTQILRSLLNGKCGYARVLGVLYPKSNEP